MSEENFTHFHPYFHFLHVRIKHLNNLCVLFEPTKLAELFCDLSPRLVHAPSPWGSAGWPLYSFGTAR